MSQTVEAILEPELAIVDAHHHLWEASELLPDIGRYLLPDFLADTESGHRVVASIYVEAGAMYRAQGPAAFRPVGEVEFANGMAAASASGTYGPTLACAGIVGFADLLLGDGVVPVLEALVAAGGGRLRGIRYMAASDPDPTLSTARRPAGLLRDTRFRAGFAGLAPLGLTFDSWLFHRQLDDAVDLARAFPETTIIIDHTGGPVRLGAYAERPDETYREWRQGIAALAACSNVVMKLGGLGMRLFALPPHEGTEPLSAHLAVHWRPYIEPSIEAFGPARCMFESNFPVDRASSSYAVLWNAFKRLAAGASLEEKVALFSGTAKRVYRL
ncbi:MAG TPA: amidohydrolase family protein [Stellaceae bacterium]|nr:amidohydrolase family protein [Stellaceae bacterium]